MWRPHSCSWIWTDGLSSPSNSPRPQSHCPFVWGANIWLMTLVCLQFASWGFPPGRSSPPHSLTAATPALGGTDRTNTWLSTWWNKTLWRRNWTAGPSWRQKHDLTRCFGLRNWMWSDPSYHNRPSPCADWSGGLALCGMSVSFCKYTKWIWPLWSSIRRTDGERGADQAS